MATRVMRPEASAKRIDRCNGNPGRGVGRIFTIGLTIAGMLYAIVLRPRHLRWGATDAEVTRSLPGDEIVPNAIQSTRAITIAAPPEDIWPWLIQMGQDRAGFYSYSWLENLFGADMHNADRIHPEWQERTVGDFVRTTSATSYNGRFAETGGWVVAIAEPDRALAYRSLDHSWSWALVLESEGNGTTRLLGRTRQAPPKGMLGPLYFLFGEPAHAVMEIGVLRGVKQRVERRQP